MICEKDNSIFKDNQDRWGYILPLKALVICKTQPVSCSSCKIDILWVVPFLQNRSHISESDETITIKNKSAMSWNAAVVAQCNELSHSPAKAMENQMPSFSAFGGLEVACWPLVPKFAGSQPAEAVGFSWRKNPQHAFLRRGSKAVGPMS
jgi:hypothetical protein